MTNSIENLKGENNSMNSPLVFMWIAFFKDGTIIEQIDKDGKEHLFKEVKDNFDKLVRFSLVNKDYSRCFTVDLIRGIILFNNYQESQPELIKEKKNVRLICFRRNFIDLTNTKITKHEIIYFLGIQWQDLEDRNHKTIMHINSQGDFIILGE